MMEEIAETPMSGAGFITAEPKQQAMDNSVLLGITVHGHHYLAITWTGTGTVGFRGYVPGERRSLPGNNTDTAADWLNCYALITRWRTKQGRSKSGDPIFDFRLSGIKRVYAEFASPSVQVNLNHCARFVFLSRAIDETDFPPMSMKRG